MSSVNEIKFKGLLSEMQEWSGRYSKKLFRAKVIRIYNKCLLRDKRGLAMKIAEKYRDELTTDIKSDMSVAVNLTIFTDAIVHHKNLNKMSRKIDKRY